MYYSGYLPFIKSPCHSFMYCSGYLPFIKDPCPHPLFIHTTLLKYCFVKKEYETRKNSEVFETKTS